MKGIALVAVSAIMLAGTLALAPMDLTATTSEEEDDDDDKKDGPALSKEIEMFNPSGEHTIAVESNENSMDARVTQEQDTTHKVDPDKDGGKDVPAQTSTKVIESGDTVTEKTKQSNLNSQKAASSQGMIVDLVFDEPGSTSYNNCRP
jgi:hypothetical protein